MAMFVLATLVMDYARAIRQRRAQLKEGLLTAGIKTVRANRRHYGGMVVHLGVVVMALGLVGAGLFRSEITVPMAPGDVLEIAGERLRFEGVTSLRRANHLAVQGRFTLLDSGRVVTPERRRFLRQEEPMTETSIDSTPLRDVYVVLHEPTEDGRWIVQAYVFPLVQFLWIGGVIFILGLLLSLSVHKQKRATEAAQPASVPAK
jgi:cytochrome c-type biogenesis protein CcmF